MNSKIIGYLLLTLSAVAASVFAARTPVMTGPFAVFLLVMAVSVLILRRSPRPEKVAEQSSGESGVFDFTACLRDITGSLDRLVGAKEELTCEKIPRELDRLIEGPLFDFIQARSSLLAAHGFAPYARVMAEFTRGERTASRAWSAAVDGYLEEAISSLELAREVFAGVREILEGLQKSSPRIGLDSY